MSVTFTKLFSSITESTVWCEPAEVRIVWITMLAMCDRHGRVWASIPGLANRARVSVKDTEKALATFLKPDKYSRTPDHDGRRIEEIDGGWRLLNHSKYVAMRDEVERREYKRDWDRTRRRRPTANPTKVSESDRVRPRPTHADADVDVDKDLKKKNGAVAPVLPGGVKPDVWADYIAHRKAKRAPVTPATEKHLIRKLERFIADGHDPNAILEESIANGWTGIFPPKNLNGGRNHGQRKTSAQIAAEAAAPYLGAFAEPRIRDIN